MKKIKYLVTVLVVVVLSSCSVNQVAKSKAYSGMYANKPVSVLIMPPINKTTNVDAKEIFHSTMLIPLANAGYYVIPPFMSMEILKKESAWDAEMFLNAPLNKFNDVFGADMALFTVITRWNKTIGATVDVEVEYIVKSTTTNEVLYQRKGSIIYDSSVSVNGGGLVGALASVAASAISTAATKFVDVAKVCNAYTLSDFPAGKYSPKYNLDGEEAAGQKDFKVKLNSKYVNY